MESTFNVKAFREITRRRWLSAFTGGALATQAAARNWNVILVVADDLGWRDLGCYGHKFHETPHLDQLALEGTRFTNAYSACPVCSPSRAALLTGRYPARIGLTDFIPGQRPRPRPMFPAPFLQQLPHEEVTLAEMLKPAGYRTASIGKWHLGNETFYPESQGFDSNFAGTIDGLPKSYFGPFHLPGMDRGTAEDFLTVKLSEAAERFIDASHRDPFFLYMPHFAVHFPFQERAALIEKYRRKGNGKDSHSAVYAAMVESVDTAMGLLRSQLERLKIADRTVIVFTSDNGGLRFEGKSQRPATDNAPLRSGKGHLYEGGIRVPLIMHMPGQKVRGTSGELVCGIDVVPTLLDVMGMAAGRAAPRVDGISLARTVASGARMKTRPLFWHYPHYSNQGGRPSGAVRWKEWKLIEFFEDSRLELFHLEEDPGERRNLVEREPRKAKELHALLREWRTEAAARMPSPDPDFRPEDAQTWSGAEPKTEPV
ncbi:MAG: sulfatase [Bryobacterales bacterium]|nr:sulfatase [Bryobacterales bacterium]